MKPEEHPLHTCPIIDVNPLKPRINPTADQFLNAEGQVRRWDDQETEDLLRKEVSTAGNELLYAYELIRKFPKSVTFYGGVQMDERSEHYQRARRIAARVCENGYAVITGGGPGIMEAANRGGFETCGYSVGFNIELPREQFINPYVTHGANFHFFFTRKVAMNFSSEVFLCFPGGFGTFDETFELLTLIQTKKSPRVPVVLVGAEFWQPFVDLIKKIMRDTYGTIGEHDMDIFKVLDDEDAIIEIIKKAPLRDKYNELLEQTTYRMPEGA